MIALAEYDGERRTFATYQTKAEANAAGKDRQREGQCQVVPRETSSGELAAEVDQWLASVSWKDVAVRYWMQNEDLSDGETLDVLYEAMTTSEDPYEDLFEKMVDNMRDGKWPQWQGDCGESVGLAVRGAE